MGFGSDAPYSKIHNEGGEVKITVSKKMKRFFWFMYSQTDDEKWKFMALTQKKEMIFTMPKRQFMGESLHFNGLLDDHAEKEILKRFKQL